MPNVHKDFHGALSYGIRFLAERYGEDRMRAFFAGLADTVYKPLVDAMRARGVAAMRDHLEHVFTVEGGEFTAEMEGETLVFHVHRCPAIAHMRERGYDIAPNFCEHTRIVNEAISNAAGCRCTVEYDQEAGRCVQRFWKEAP